MQILVFCQNKKVNTKRLVKVLGSGMHRISDTGCEDSTLPKVLSCENSHGGEQRGVDILLHAQRLPCDGRPALGVDTSHLNTNPLM